MRTTSKLLLLATAALLLVPAAHAKHTVTVTSGEAKEGTYTMTVDVANFNLVDFTTKTSANNHVKGEGHIHYLVNGVDACSAQKASCSAPTDYATTSKSFTFTGLKAGDKLQAELVLSDHGASGTDANSNLDGSRVLSSEQVVKGNSAPGVGILAGILLLGLAMLAQRKD